MKLPLLIVAFLLPVIVWSQKQFIVDSQWQKGRTIFIRGIEVNTNNVCFFSIREKGMGRVINLVGLQGTFYPEGIGKRRVHFIINQ